MEARWKRQRMPTTGQRRSERFRDPLANETVMAGTRRCRPDVRSEGDGHCARVATRRKKARTPRLDGVAMHLLA
jgi:hypothetical protein